MPMRDLRFNLATASCFGKPLLALSDLEYSEAVLKWKDREDSFRLSRAVIFNLGKLIGL